MSRSHRVTTFRLPVVLVSVTFSSRPITELVRFGSVRCGVERRMCAVKFMFSINVVRMQFVFCRKLPLATTVRKRLHRHRMFVHLCLIV